MTAEGPSAGPGAARGGRIDAAMRRVVIAVILGTIMSVLDTTIVNIALERLSSDLHTKLSTVQWVVSAYLLALAAVVPTTAWAARRFGARRLFIVSMVLFTVGSALCGLATSTTELIVFRVLQGVGGGMIAPVGQIILVKASGPRNLPRVMSAFSVPLILAPVLGPTIGGFLIDSVGWRAIFYVNVPIGVLAVATALRNLAPDRPEEAGRFDTTGLLLAAGGLAGITYGLAEAGSPGGLLDRVGIPLALGAALLATFVVRSLRVPRPLLDLRLYADKAFTATSIVRFSLGAALFGSLVLLPLYLQTARHQDAVHAGLLLAPRGIGAAVASWLSARLTDQLGAGLTTVIGSTMAAAFTAPFVLLGPHTPYLTIEGALLLQGFGLGLTFTPAMTAAFRSLRPSQVNDASPQQNVILQVGGSIGTAVLTVILAHHLAGAVGPAARASAYGSTFWWAFAATVLAIIPTIALFLLERRPAPHLPAPQQVGGGVARAEGARAEGAAD